MNRQEIFNTVATHLIKQNAKSKAVIPSTADDDDDDDVVGLGCAYRGNNGLKCAVGCLIPDELYSPGFEDVAVENLLNQNQSLADHLGIKSSWDMRTLGQLQFIHDHIEIEDWPTALRDFATREDLQMPPALINKLAEPKVYL